MELSDRSFDLRSFFPFSICDQSFLAQALAFGKCVKYESGETVFFSGSPAKHCGLILEGQAVAFKMDENGRRYQLCLDEGCLIGQETITPDNKYTAKITALSELYVYFWNGTGIRKLMDLDPDFAAAMRMMDNGRVYQEQWLIPETDITDPVICAQQMHWLSILVPALIIIPLLVVCLMVTGMMIRRYAIAWLLVFPLLAAAGTLLYKKITVRMNEYIIVTSRNLILVPGNSDAEMPVIRLGDLQSLTLHQNNLERIFDIGRVSFEASDHELMSPLLKSPGLIASLIREFAVRASQGRIIPLRRENGMVEKNTVRRVYETAEPEGDTSKNRGTAVPPFTPVRIHAHWALLVRMIIQPVALLLVAMYAAYYFRASSHADTIRKLLFAAALGALCWGVCRFFTWRNHLFLIEEDCVKNYSRKPFAQENLEVAMNHKIQSVSYEKTGFFQVLLNYGTVLVMAGEGELDFEYVRDPRQVQQMIMKACAYYEDKLRKEEELRRREYISDLFRDIKNESQGGLSL